MTKEERIKIYEEVQKEVLAENNEEVSIAEIHSIIESQFKIMMYGFNKGVSCTLPYIGKFIAFNMDFYAEKVIIPNKELQLKLREKGRDNEATLIYIDSMNRYKQAVKTKVKEEEIDANVLINIPNLDGSTDTLDIFKNLR